MENKLTKLSLALKSMNHIEASSCVDSLIYDLSNTFENIKTAQSSELENIMRFIGQDEVTRAAPTSVEAWQRILTDYDKVPGQVNMIHKLAENIISTVISPLTSKKQELQSVSGQITPEEQALTRAMLSSQNSFTMSDIQDLQRQAALQRAGITKTASSAYLDEYISQCIKDSKKFEKLALESLSANSSFDDLVKIGKDSQQSFWSRLLTGDKAKAAARAAGKKPGFWGKLLPGIGLLFSLPLTLKNLYEAYNNGKAIISDLPLDKHGISRLAAVTGSPLHLPLLIGQIKEAIAENSNNPENLYEILEIIKTISAYWLDVIFTITNAIALVIDILSIAAIFVDGPFPIGDVVAGFLGFFLTLGLVGFELASEYFMGTFWDKQKEKIKKIAEEKVKEGEFSIMPIPEQYDAPPLSQATPQVTPAKEPSPIEARKNDIDSARQGFRDAHQRLTEQLA